jgi:hypothetical protein
VNTTAIMSSIFFIFIVLVLGMFIVFISFFGLFFGSNLLD